MSDGERRDGRILTAQTDIDAQDLGSRSSLVKALDLSTHPWVSRACRDLAQELEVLERLPCADDDRAERVLGEAHR